VSSRETASNRFPGLELSAEDRVALKALGRQRVSARVWRRVRILQLLDRGWTMADAGIAVGTYPREVRRVGWRYLKGGLAEALGEDARPKQAKLLDARQQAAIVAMVCAPPPPGRTRWTLMLIAEEATRRKIVAKVGRETIRRMLTRHELKPWREKNVVRPERG
jgi:Homeodomain-like domain